MSLHQKRTVADRSDPTELLGLLDAFPDPVVVGFHPARRHLDLHVAPLPPDARAGSAGLFGMRAGPSWSAVGVSFSGRAREIPSREVVGNGASAALVVTREGRTASRMSIEDSPQGDETLVDGAEGVVVDALHRMLDLPAPGRPPSPAVLALTIWAHVVIDHLFLHGRLTWADALALHPGDPGEVGPDAVGPSTETLVEATLRSTDGFEWESMHARAAAGQARVADLTAREAAWMDTTMFARWVTGSLPDPGMVVDLLRTHLLHDVADRLDRVVDEIVRLDAGTEVDDG